MNSNWIRVQDRKRHFIAAGSTVCVYAIAFLGAWLVGSLVPASLASVPGTIIVELGGTEGPPGEVPQGLESAPERPLGAPPGTAPLPAATTEAVASVPAATAPAAAPSKVASIPELAAKPVTKTVSVAKTPVKAVPAKVAPPKAAPVKPVPAAKAPPEKAAPPDKAAPPKAAVPEPVSAKTIPAPTAAEKEAAAKAAAAQAAAQAAENEAAMKAAAAQAAIEDAATAALAAERSGPPKTRTFGTGSSTGKAAPSGSGGSGSGVAGGTGSVTFKGAEMGNALATTFGASSGQVGRNIYVPIYLYMPLPIRIDDSIYRNIQYKDTFRSSYQQSGSEWRLKGQVPLAQRGDFWTMLEAAGYDASTADFKTVNKLAPVVLEFVVGPLTRNKVDLVDLRIISSSGSSEVDEAVIYGFRQASFFNKTGNSINGKFVYGF